MHRIERLKEEIQHLVSSIILFELADPRLKAVTVTHVALTKDIGLARIYYEVIDPKADREAIEKALQKASGFIRRRLASDLRIKQVPVIEFYFDNEKEQILRVEQLLNKI